MKLTISISVIILIISITNIFAYTLENHGVILKHEEWHDVSLPENLKHGNVNIQNSNTTSDQSPEFSSNFTNNLNEKR